MKLNVMFTIAAVYGFLVGLPALLAPGTIAAMSAPGVSLPPGILMGFRFVGIELVGLGLIAWFVRNADASKARDGVTLGFTIYFALHALTSLYGAFTDTSQPAHWFMATLQGLIAVGFFMAGKASMAETAK